MKLKSTLIASCDGLLGNGSSLFSTASIGCIHCFNDVSDYTAVTVQNRITQQMKANLLANLAYYINNFQILETLQKNTMQYSKLTNAISRMEMFVIM